jgi:hypothetical protein
MARHAVGATMKVKQDLGGVRFTATPRHMVNPFAGGPRGYALLEDYTDEQELLARLSVHRPYQQPEHHPPHGLWRSFVEKFGWTAVGVGAVSGVGFAMPAISHVMIVNVSAKPATPTAPLVNDAPATGSQQSSTRDGDGFDDLLHEVVQECADKAIEWCMEKVGKEIARAIFGWKPEADDEDNPDAPMQAIRALAQEADALKARPVFRMPASFGVATETAPHRSFSWATVQPSDEPMPPELPPMPIELELPDLVMLSALMGQEPTVTAEEFARAMEAVPIAEGSRFAVLGRKVSVQLAALARFALCCEDGLVSQMADASLDDIATEIRKALFSAAFSRVAAYAIVGAAVSVGHVTLVHYCKVLTRRV